jgi:hypothetical membrane protein
VKVVEAPNALRELDWLYRNLRRVPMISIGGALLLLAIVFWALYSPRADSTCAGMEVSTTYWGHRLLVQFALLRATSRPGWCERMLFYLNIISTLALALVGYFQRHGIRRYCYHRLR